MSFTGLLEKHLKHSNKMYKVFVLCMLAGSALAANLVEVLQAGGQSTLISLVEEAGLASALLAGNNLTVFAPTNAAFARLGSSGLRHLEQNPSVLHEILLYHVVPHTEYSAGLYNREYIRTLDKHHDVIRIGVSGSQVYVNNAKVTKANIGATNGVVHVIDHVLVPLRYAGQLIFG